MTEIRHQAVVDVALSGKRLDQALARLFSDYSRNRLQAWVREGRVRVDGALRKPRDKVFTGEHIELQVQLQEQVACAPEAMPLSIVYEDEELLVVNKPAGLVVHPGAGNRNGTLQNGLLHYDAELIQLPRAGIVHRLDKDTTGLMVVARTLPAYKYLVDELQARRIKREYQALVVGQPLTGGSIDAPVGRHPRQRTRMAVVDAGKPALTHYQVHEPFRIHSLLDVRLETGRTHQIRVHLAWLRMPIVGDPLYGGRPKLPPAADAKLKSALQSFPRQALHAFRLGLIHPHSGQPMSWTATLPEDMQQLLELLRTDRQQHG